MAQPSGEIAAHGARTLRPSEVAVEAVLALHVKTFDGYLYQETCGHCSDHEGGGWALWPCATVRAITAAYEALAPAEGGAS